LTFNRPERLNALSYEMLDILGDHIRTIQLNDEIRAVVVIGAGRAFCAGTDLQELQNGARAARGSSSSVVRKRDDAEPAPWSFTNLRVPVVAAINGAAVGLGAEMTAMCDARIASEAARVGWVFPHRGLVPDTGAGTWLLPRIVGVARAARILFSGEIMDAATMLELGLVEKVVPPDQLRGEALAMAEDLSRGSPLAIGEIKRLLYQGLTRDVGEHIADNSATLNRMFQSADHKEGVTSFLEKRDPQWTGR
jgi:enoyl-CoA hydratase/carnithine racemase